MTSSDKPPNDGSWMEPCGARAKLGLMLLLVASFVIQTHLVYSDPPSGPSLSATARQGRRVWHDRNCQSCHQLYGFGGFIGPDLTNAARRVTPARLRRLLTEGSGRMPAFHLGDDDIAAVSAFLEAMDATGQGQASLDAPITWDPDLNRAVLREIRSALGDEIDPALRRGHEMFISRACQSCHLPISPVSTPGPDLLGVRFRLTAAQIEAVLEHGRPPDMPAPVLSDLERAAMLSFLRWLGGNQSRIMRGAQGERDHRRVWAELPWWEFER